MFSQLWNAVASFFATIINAIYTFVPSYGWAIIIFTIITRLILLPLTLQQLKSSEAMKRITPLMNELEKKYKDDPQKKAEEQMRLYRENNIKPLAGCLQMLIQFPLILIIYQVVQKPLTHIIKLPQAAIDTIVGRLEGFSFTTEFALIQEITTRGTAIADSFKDLGYRVINFKFLGLDLLQVPNFKVPSAIWIIPALVVFSQWLSMRLIMPPAPRDEKDESQATQFNSTFMKIVPWMLGYISFVTPAALGLYWTTSSFIQTIQQYILNKYVKKGDVAPVKIAETKEESPAAAVSTKKPTDPGKKNAKNKKKK